MNAATTGALLAVIAVAMAATAHPAAHAVHADDPTVRTPEGNAVPGCQEDDTCFIPSTIEVGPGTTVTWENNDIVPHTVTSGAAGSPTGEFDSGLTDGGTTFEHTFEEVGEYPYFCLVHPWMAGTVFVTEAHSHPGPGERRTDIPDISEGSDGGAGVRRAGRRRGDLPGVWPPGHADRHAHGPDRRDGRV